MYNLSFQFPSYLDSLQLLAVSLILMSEVWFVNIFTI